MRCCHSNTCGISAVNGVSHLKKQRGKLNVSVILLRFFLIADCVSYIWTADAIYIDEWSDSDGESDEGRALKEQRERHRDLVAAWTELLHVVNGPM